MALYHIIYYLLSASGLYSSPENSIPASPRDPMINDGLFEGDILLDKDFERNAVPYDSQRWENGVVPYYVAPELAQHMNVIRASMKHIENYTCIRFKPATVERDYVWMQKLDGCYSNWGRTGGPQTLSLGDRCENPGIIVHELMHAIGFEHEHNRSDRDTYLNIYWGNIIPKWFSAFKKLQPNENRLLTGFDFNSIMLYGSNSFAKVKGQYSMTGKNGELLPEVYEKNALSRSDVQRVNMLYRCRY